MKKIRATRLMAMVMAVCMVLALAVPVSAATKTYLELEITENESVKPSGTSTVTVSAESGSVVMGAKVTPVLVQLLVANFEGVAKTNRSGLWDFESDQMGKTIEAGLAAYRKSVEDGNWDAWHNWLDTFAGKDEITGDGTDKSDLVSLLKEDKTVGDMGAVGTSYQLTYTPADVADDDPAKGNTYVFTLTLKQKTIGGGGGGGGAAAPTKYAITVSEVANATVNVSATQAAAGDKITVTITINEGYEMVSFEVKGASGNDVAATGYGDGTYTFTMPAEAVTVTLTTKEKAPDCPAAQFTDVDLNEWYHEALDYVLANNLMAGYDEKSFGPNDSLSRAMVAQIFYNLEGQPAGDYVNPFPDVAEDKWYRNAISWAYANKVVAGYGDGLYRPEQDVTREELVQIFFNYAKAKGWNNGEQSDLTAFADHLKVADWHEEAVSWGISAKLLSGKGGNKIDPKADSLRCEAAQMLMNLCVNIRK